MSRWKHPWTIITGMGPQSLHDGWLWLIVSGFVRTQNPELHSHPVRRVLLFFLFFFFFVFFLFLCAKFVHFFAFVSQPVEDQGVHIPDQTVIKKGKQFPPRYHACFCKLHTPPHPLLTHTYTRTCTHTIRHSAWVNSLQCSNAWLILIRSSLFFITWFPSASNWRHLFPRWWNLLSAFQSRGEMSGAGGLLLGPWY